MADGLRAEDIKPGSPEWWIRRLEKRLNERRKEFKRYDDYYEGEHPLLFATAKFERAFGQLFKGFADNWCDLVVDAVDERLKPQGFRYGKDQPGDKDAWRMWQANNLDAGSQIGHTEALINSESSVLVWAGQDDETPSITIEDPMQMIVESQGGVRRAAFKRWLDDDDHEMATLYLPDGIYKYKSDRKRWSTTWMPVGRWKQRDVQGETWPLKNPMGIVPVVPLANRPRLRRAGVSEIKKVIPIQDGVNKLVADMMVASEFHSVRQRWATGVDTPIDPETGQPIPVFKAAVDSMFTTKNKDAAFGDFEASDLGNFVKGVEMLVQHIASQTRTPPHYFYLKGEFPSGESIKSAETGLVAKALKKMIHFGEGWEEVIRLAFLVIGDDTRGHARETETIWRDPESRTEGEHVDALLKMKQLGIPDEILWERAGFSPTEIERIKTVKAQEALDLDAAFDPFAPRPAPEPANAGAS